MSYLDLSDHPGTTLNLIERHSIVPILEGTAAEIDDPDEGGYLNESAFLIQMDAGVEHAIEFRGLAQFPVKDGTTVLFKCFARLATGQTINVATPFIGGGFLPIDPPLFSGVATDCDEATDSYTFTKAEWDLLILRNTVINPDDEGDVVRFRIEGTGRASDCIDPPQPGEDPDTGDTLSRTWCYFQASYTYSITDVVAPAAPPSLLLRSHSRVLTQGPREEAGTFHYHYGKFVLDPETGGLLVEHRAGLKVILAGAGVSPGGDGRPSEGSLEFRTTGELYGSVTRFSTHAGCCIS